MPRNLEVTDFGPREGISQEDQGAAFGWFRLPALSTGLTDIRYLVFELRDGLIAKYPFPENTFDVATPSRTRGS